MAALVARKRGFVGRRPRLNRILNTWKLKRVHTHSPSFHYYGRALASIAWPSFSFSSEGSANSLEITLSNLQGLPLRSEDA
jgi:hypothetical protein